MKWLKSLIFVGLLSVLGAVNLAQEVVTLTLGQEITGTFNETNTQYEITLNAGDRVVISLQSEANGSYLSLMDSRGTTSYADEVNYGVDEVARVMIQPLKSDTYNIFLSGMLDTTYTLSAQVLEPASFDVIALDQTVFNIVENGGIAEYTFEVPENRYILVLLESWGFSGLATLLDGEGNFIADSQSLGRILQRVPAGTYTVNISNPYSDGMDNTGAYTQSYAMRVQPLDVQTLELNQVAEFSMTPTERSRFFAFEANEGDVINIFMENSDGLYLPFTLVKDGIPVSYADTVTPRSAINRLTLPSSGTYIIDLTPYGMGISGTSRLIVETTQKQYLTAEGYTMTFDSRTAQDVLTLSVEAGKKYRLTFTTDRPTSNHDVYLMEQMTQIAFNSNVGVESWSIVFTAQSTTEYTLQVRSVEYYAEFPSDSEALLVTIEEVR